MTKIKLAREHSMTRLFIGGDWHPAIAGGVTVAYSPATGEQIGEVVEGGREEAQMAVSAARAAFPSWKARTPFERASALHRIGDVCMRRRDELARALTLDQGKPLYREAYPEVDELVSMWHAAAENAIRQEGILAPSASADHRILLVRRPKGPVAVVTPWNWPYTMPAELVAPALACGNTVVWTPAPTTAVCSGVLAACIAEADLPPGVFNFVLGPGPIVGDEIVSHPDVAVVGFIGSTVTGLRIAERAAGKSLLLEMGGNGPLVILADADLDLATAAAVDACFQCAGQNCTAAGRLLVHEAVYDEFADRLAVQVADEVKLGDPFAATTTMGPLNNAGVAAKMDRHVADALKRGATALTGGARDSVLPGDLYWKPTVLVDVSRDSVAATDETFGPIAPLLRISSIEEAIDLTNASPYGLTSAIFTSDLGEALRFADRVRSGLVNVNESTNYWEGHVPFGGGGGTASGIGRVGGRHTMDSLSELQTVTLRS